MEQDKHQLRPSHIISVNYLDLDQAYATHEFKFRVNPYIKAILSKTRENSRLKTRHLKGITAEQLFIMSIKSLFEDKVLNSQLCLFYFIVTKHIIAHTLFILFYLIARNA